VSMNILEDQVTDLNSLAGTPLPHLAAAAASVVSMSGSPPLAMAESPVESGIMNNNNNKNNNAKKRKSIAAAAGEEGGGGIGNINGTTTVSGNGEQRRAKRNRYISIAW